ncbi:hypothetical protein [Actinomadura livida]|uniref:Uncharacterized protein n=1 Tax=Actinomadura livida TaxID=79909 RepID=A0A7W7IJ85_9ACTN|nr:MULTISPECIES: hypothetical protein [Actinomadura]MBB4778063.1 hypothetical protein [Actinomadura catellatispora]GGT96822.1 hypothetical protein GCM10010208_20100 [Actinomadura livida]
MDTQMLVDERELERLRADFDGWRIWRAVKQDGRLGEWVASLHDPRVGVEPTLMYPTAPLLRAALLRQAEKARARNR